MIVKRLHKSRKDQATVLEIDDGSLKRMAADYSKHAKKSDKVLRSHLHEIVTKHIADVMLHHSPADYWTDISVSDPHDLKLEQHLRDQFLSDEVIG